MLAEQTYRYFCDIPNSGGASNLPDACFQPDGSRFAVTYRDCHAVRVFDATTFDMVRDIRNPDAQLDFPHGLMMTNKHIIVSNVHKDNRKPSALNVYGLDDGSNSPVSVFETPVEHLREAHSFALHDEVLLATYCDGAKALVSYRFDDDTGAITGPIDLKESWFAVFGDPKGVAFNEAGTKAFVTFVTAPPQRGVLRNLSKLLRGKSDTREFLQVTDFDSRWPFRLAKGDREAGEGITNGIAVFDVSQDGMLAEEPAEIALWPTYSRLENVQIISGLCIVADPLNDTVYIYPFDGNNIPDTPAQVITEHLSFPHDACLSPDLQTLVIANNGLKVVSGAARFGRHIEGRDRVTIYKRAP